MTTTTQTELITPRELVDCPFMEPYTDGSYVETSEVNRAWRCNACGLVWDRRHYAEHCGTRGHKATWQRGYGATAVINGIPNYKGFAEVRAMRREALDAERIADDPQLIELRCRRIREREDRRQAWADRARLEDWRLDWELSLWDDLAEHGRR